MEAENISPLIFELTNAEEIQAFEQALADYVKSFNTFYVDHIKLNEVFTYLKGNNYENPARIFTAIVDLQINFVYLGLDLTVSGGYNNVINHDFAVRRNNGQSLPLKEAIPFLLKIHNADTSYCLRYRAVWDKLMGILFLVFLPEKYESYVSAKSKLAFFSKYLTEYPGAKEIVTNVWTEHVGSLKNLLEEFENKFRTPEIHGSGTLRKYAFIVDPEHRLVMSTNYHNAINETVMKLGAIFKTAKTSL
jgi:hypothetical protein